jgi:small multidrug resistance pump
MLLAWVFLGLAICFEVTATSSLKLASDGKPWAIAIVVVGFAASFGLLILALKKLDVSTTYAVWAGAGTALITVIGMTFLGDTVSAAKIGSIALIIVGVVGLNLAGAH